MYRSCFQHHFEQSLLDSYIPETQRKEATIFGDYISEPSISSEPRVQATFTGWDLNTALRILAWKTEPHKPRIGFVDKEILTDHPMLLEVRLSPKYNGRLYEDGGEGILVTGDVDLDDVDLLLSSRTNKLDPSKLDGMAKSYLEEVRGRFDPNQPDLIQRFSESPDEIIDKIALMYCYGSKNYTGSDQQKEPIRKFLETMKAKI